MTWNVITAGPSAGKTSTLRTLAAEGHHIAPEAARIVIDQAISEGHDPEHARDAYDDFQNTVEATNRRIENNLPTNGETVFLDRSLADNIAYRRVLHDENPTALMDECRNRYDTVFLLEQLPFEADYARDEDAQLAKDLHEALRTTYTELGYEVVEIPVEPIDQRVSRIISNL